MVKMRNAGNQSGPPSNKKQRDNHLRHYTALNSHYYRPFGVLCHVPGTVLVVYSLHLAYK